MNVQVLLVLYLCWISDNVWSFESLNEEKRLSLHLWKDYDTRVRPVHNSSETLTVHWETLLVNILDTWVDNFLKWNSSDFGEVTVLYRPIDSIWKPDINLLNNAGPGNIIMGDRIASINSSGFVRWSPHLRLHALSSVDFTYFPYDTQQFYATLLSWLPASMQNLTLMDSEDQLKFIDGSAEWSMRSLHVVAKVLSNEAREHSAITYTFKLQRRSAFYQHFIIFPTLITGILTLMMFFFSHENNQRFIFGGLLFLCLLFIVGLVQVYMPVGLTQSPVLASVIAYQFFALFLIFCCSILTFNIYNIKGLDVPPIVRRIFLNPVVTCVLCLSSNGNTRIHDTKESNVAYMHLPEAEFSHGQDQRVTPGSKTEDELETVLNKLTNCLSVLSKGNNSHSSWKQLALVLDFVFFIIISTISAIVIAKLCH